MCCIVQEEEFRLRHESLIAQQRREAQMVRRRLEDEKQRIKQLQKEAVYSYFSKVGTYQMNNI